MKKGEAAFRDDMLEKKRAPASTSPCGFSNPGE
jgi:hypothetical protein